MAQPSGPTTLYRLFSADGDLLYVGIAGNPGRRFEQHRKEKGWWGEVAEIKLEHFSDRPSALKAETQAIRTESPSYNWLPSAKRRPTPAPARRFDSPPIASIVQSKPNPRSPSGIFVTVRCPFCGEEHHHGISSGEVSREHRSAHCADWDARGRAIPRHPDRHLGYLIA